MIDYFTSFFSYIFIISMVTIFSNHNHYPFKIPKNIMLSYNLLNSLINLYIVIGLYPYIVNYNVGYSYPYNQTIEKYIFLHYLTKYLDFFDTIFMILNKNWKQVHFLQIYHHSTIGIMWHWVWKDNPNLSATCAFGAFANSSIHFLMYIHYAITTLGYRNPFKKMMTSLQMFQFCICLIHAICWNKNYPQYTIFGNVQICYMTSMILLFYLTVYKKKNILVKEKTYDKEILSIKIDETTYDATNFILKHPGGNIIKYFNNIDATEVFSTFHSNSSFAYKMLKSLPIIEKNNDLGKSIIEQNNSIKKEGFKKMVAKWKSKGLFSGRNKDFILWGLVTFILTITGGFFQMRGYPIIGGLIIGFSWAHCGFVQHHLGHLGFTGLSSIDYTIQGFFEGILKGGSPSWWRNRHNKHHAMPNMIGYDGDLRTTPFFAWDEILVKKIPTYILKIQHLLFIPMLALYVPVFFITTKIYMFQKRKWEEIGLVITHFLFFSLFFRNWHDFILFYMIGYGFQGLYLGIMFGINHFAMPRIFDKKTNWAEWQMAGTCNWGVGSRFAEYISGFLNLQIEHHLVPQMPPENYHLITNDIKEYAKLNDIKYEEYSFKDAFINMMKGLRKTALIELKKREFNKKL